ncbi:MAG: hypothetical protein FWD99_08000 [Oscillospiraceae bacterium]|nr:hypothetical protein [Oscillospiraceae bacterium]
MDLQVFAEQHPQMHHEMVKGVRAFVERHQISPGLPLMEWDHMVGLILDELPQEVFAAYPAEPAVEAMGPGRGHGHRPGPGHGMPGFRPGRGGGALRDILRLLFLRELLG